LGIGARECANFSQSTWASLTPDDIRSLVAAFDKAWEVVQASGAVFETKTKADIARSISQNTSLLLPRTASVTRSSFAMGL
jgi:hypothetical protein